jgi:hypothetical protein
MQFLPLSSSDSNTDSTRSSFSIEHMLPFDVIPRLKKLAYDKDESFHNSLSQSLFDPRSFSNFRTELEKIAVVDRANTAVRESAEILGLYSSEMRAASESMTTSKRKGPTSPTPETPGLKPDVSAVIAAVGQTADLDHLQIALKRCQECFNTFASEFAPNAPDKVVTTEAIKKKVQAMDMQLRIAIKKAELVKEMLEGTIRR